MALKNQVQALKNAGYVNFGFDKAGGPNVISNPLPNHPLTKRYKINAVLESFTERKKTCVKNVITPMKVIHEELVQVGFLQFRRGEAIEEERLSKGYC